MTRRTLALSVLIVVVLAAGVAGAFTYDGGAYPDEWDERVADLAEFVEDERELRFDHPVHVDFLADDEFNELVTTDEADLTEEDKEEIEHTAAILRALGLIGGDVDVFDAFNELNEVGILAFYDPEEERVRVKGTEMSPNLRVTLVHELTHALQDQHFDIGDLQEVEEETESSTYRGLVEGDASRVQHAYTETLDEDEAADLAEEEDALGQEVEAADLPAVLEAILGAPYALGEPLASALVEADGIRALNDALQDPPTTDEPLLDPLGYLEAGDDEEAVDVDTPALEDGEEEVDRGFFGSIAWYVMLAQRIDSREALGAVDGWGGDAYVAYDRDGTVCVRIAYRGDTADDAKELEDALASWVREMPPGAASVGRDGDDGLTLQSCDPGDEASVPEEVTAQDLMVVPAVRSSLAVLVLSQGADADQARCFADAVVGELSNEQLVSDEADPAIVRALTEIGARCRAA